MSVSVRFQDIVLGLPYPARNPAKIKNISNVGAEKKRLTNELVHLIFQNDRC
jgi:hypothetical protein